MHWPPQSDTIAAQQQHPLLVVAKRLCRLPLTQAEGDRAVREIMPGATIFKPGHLIGNEDRLYNTYAQLAKVRGRPLQPLPELCHMQGEVRYIGADPSFAKLTF